ncbi:MAG: hypothetical protein FWE24_10095 [Defluviitaleaceae bacterium]|nr:hypothetical protein [Defluviitaleaceae bacterium]
MKKTIIGIALLVSGIITISLLILSAMQYLPHMTVWSNNYPSRLFFLIFAGQSRFGDGASGLALGLPFVFGIVLIVLGLIILTIEYFKKDNA